MTVTVAVPGLVGTNSSRRKGAFRRVTGAALRTGRGKIGLGLTLLVTAIAVIGPFVAPHSPTAFTTAPYSAPGGTAGLLGGDELGRDVLSRLLHGGYFLLFLAAVATFLGVAVGAAIGIVSAYRQGWAGGFLMRIVDIILCVPQLVFVLLIVSVVGAKSWILVLAVAGVQAPQVARVIYSAGQDVCERDYVKAVALWGVSPRRVIWRQVMPNLITPLAVETGLRLSFSIILISGLNFLGFGVQPPAPSWGVMINENRLGLVANPYGVIAPAILLGVLAVGTNMLADAIARANAGDGRVSEPGESA
jgi:peptide/nickel transport system permease protein